MTNIISPINQLGYGIAGLNLIKGLHELRHQVSLFPLGQPTVSNREDAELVSGLIENSRLPDFEADCIRIWHQHDMSQFVGGGSHIGMPIFELDDFNDMEKHHLSNLDRVFVCSEWARQVVYDTIDHKDVHVIPLGVDVSVFKPAAPNATPNTVFFNCGKWEVRKGHDVLHRAFSEAFTKEDNVELWMMCQNPFNTDEENQAWANLYEKSPLGDKVKIIRRVESQEEVYNIMAKTDCGVFPSRGEGWNLELLEMMACGKKVIATNYSAHTEFCNLDNSLCIECDDKELAYDGKWFHGKCGSWASLGETQVSCIAEAMRSVHKQKKNEGVLPPNSHGIKTASHFSWKNAALKMLEALNGDV